jgi:ribbon-helix-helix CopG family protein
VPSGRTGLSVTSYLTPQYNERYTFHYMTSPLQPTAFRLDPALLAALQKIKRRDGVPISEQVRRALQAWIGSRGAVKAAPRRAPARRKA